MTFNHYLSFDHTSQQRLDQDKSAGIVEVLLQEWGICLRKKYYRLGTVNSKSFVGKVLLRIKWKFELN